MLANQQKPFVGGGFAVAFVVLIVLVNISYPDATVCIWGGLGPASPSDFLFKILSTYASNIRQNVLSEISDLHIKILNNFSCSISADLPKGKKTLRLEEKTNPMELDLDLDLGSYHVAI